MTSASPSSSEQSSTARDLAKRIAATVIVAGLLAWVLHTAWVDARKIDWASLQMRPALIGLSVVVVITAWCWQALLWGFMLRALGYRVDPFVAVRAAVVGNLGNYIPGKVFIVILRKKLLPGDEVPMVTVASSVVLETLLRNLMAAILASVGLWYMGVGKSYLGGLALLLVISVIAVHPAIFNRLTDFVLRKLNRPPLPNSLNMLHLLGLLGGFFIYWGLYSLAFFLLARGTLGAEWADFIAMGVAIVISLIASMMAVFTPVGLGVADATLTGVLSLTGAITGAGVLAVIMRVWRTLTELGVGALLWIIPVGPRLDLSRTVEEGEEAAVD